MSDAGWQVELRGRLGDLRVDVAFEADGGPTLLVGPNGAGKTTVLRALAGAEAGLEGCLRVTLGTVEEDDEFLAALTGVLTGR